MLTQPYVPVEFADFSVYNASLENREWSSSKADLTDSRALEKAVHCKLELQWPGMVRHNPGLASDYT